MSGGTGTDLESEVKAWRDRRDEKVKAIIRETRSNNLVWDYRELSKDWGHRNPYRYLDTIGIVDKEILGVQLQKVERDDGSFEYSMYFERRDAHEDFRVNVHENHDSLVQEFAKYMFAD